jgi:hypothetical protein
MVCAPHTGMCSAYRELLRICAWTADAQTVARFPVSKETYYSVKRDLLQCQKRPGSPIIRQCDSPLVREPAASVRATPPINFCLQKKTFQKKYRASRVSTRDAPYQFCFLDNGIFTIQSHLYSDTLQYTGLLENLLPIKASINASFTLYSPQSWGQNDLYTHVSWYQYIFKKKKSQSWGQHDLYTRLIVSVCDLKVSYLKITSGHVLLMCDVLLLCCCCVANVLLM